MQASIAKFTLTIDPDAKFARVVDGKDRGVGAVASQDLHNRISQTAKPQLEHRRRDNAYFFNSRFGHAHPPLTRLLRNGKVERHLSAGKQKDMFGSHLRRDSRSA